MTEPSKSAPEINVESNDDLTRRQWLLRLGEMVALAGVSGLVPETATALLQGEHASSSRSSSAQLASRAALPPGLYDPSQDHLIHALSSAGKKFVPPEGSETDYVLPRNGPFQPQFFTANEFRTVSRFIEIILGNVDAAASSQAAEWLDLWLHAASGVREAAQHLDPLHRAVAVAYYGEDVVRSLETADPQGTARAGLKALDEISVQQHGKPFSGLTADQQVQLIESVGAAGPDSAARKFFDLLRREAIRGYYTSAQGLADLDYQGNAYYPECPGCEGKS